MSRNIKSGVLGNSRAFTLAELVVASFITVYVLLSVWSVYYIGLKWWHEMAPIVEAQRTARIALSSVIDGIEDSTAGAAEHIGSVDYSFRNGMAWMAITNEDIVQDASFVTPVISSDKHRIDFKLENDAPAVNGRAFYLGTDLATGAKAVYYRNNAGVTRKVIGTEVTPEHGEDTGGLNLTFEKWDPQSDTVLNSGDAGYSDSKLIKVTVTVQKTIRGTKHESSPLVVEYSDFIYCRNL